MSSQTPASKRSSKRKHGADGAAASAAGAPAPDLAQWMRDVIAAPPAPEDAPDPADASAILPVHMETDAPEEEDDDDDAAAAAAGALSSTPLAGAAVAARSNPSAVPRMHFPSVRDLFLALGSNKSDTVFGGLVRFHRQMKEETTGLYAGLVPSQPILAQYWSLSPDGKELFTILDNVTSTGKSAVYEGSDARRGTAITGKVFEVFARMLLPSTAGFNYAASNGLIRKVIRSKHFGTLARLTRMQDQRLVQAALSFLLHAVICCGSNTTLPSVAGTTASSGPTVIPSGPRAPGLGSSALLRELVQKFDWSAKAFLDVPYKPFVAAHAHHAGGVSSKSAKEKAKAITESGGGAAAAAKGDNHALMVQSLYKSRQLYILLLVELLAKRDLTITTHLLNVKGYLTSVLKNLSRDASSGGHLDALLHAYTYHILRLPGLSLNQKYGFFNGYVLEHLLELFRPRTTPLIMPTVAHVPGGKVQKVPRGLKPATYREQVELIERTVREIILYVAKHQVSSSAAAAGGARSGVMRAGVTGETQSTLRQHGPLLLRILSHLHPNESALEQKLLLDILSSFPPPLLAEYLAKWSFTFDPRVSARWVNHVALVGKVWEVRWEKKLVEAAQAAAGGMPGFIGGASSAGRGVEDEFVLLHPLQPIGRVGAAAGQGASSAASSSTPVLFSFLLPPTLSHRLILSQCLQHPSALVKYTTLNMLRALLRRFQELLQEYERQWRRSQGLSSTDPAPLALQHALASARSHMAKIMPDVQVLFALRAREEMKPGSEQASSIEEMQRELEVVLAAGEGGETAEEAEQSSKKKLKTSSGAAAGGAPKAPDSSTPDLSVPSTPQLALQSRHVLHSRFLGVVASFARVLPDTIVEGRIDPFKLLPASLAQGEVGSSAMSWWSLHELTALFAHAQAAKHARLFALSKQQKGAASGAEATKQALVPLSPFGQLLRLHFLLSPSSGPVGANFIVNGHEAALCAGEDLPEMASPPRVRERVASMLAEVTEHTGLFTTSSSTGSESVVGREEIALWLSSLSTPADVRFLEHLVAFLVHSNTAWMRMEDAEASDKGQGQQGESKAKLSLLLSTALSPAFQSYFVASTPFATPSELAAPLSSFLLRFLGRVLSSPTLGSLVHPQLERVVVAQLAKLEGGEKEAPLFAGLRSACASMSTLLKAVSSATKKGAVEPAAGSLESFQSLLGALLAKPSSASAQEAVVSAASTHFGVSHRSESSKSVLLGYLREAMLTLLQQGAAKTEAAVGALWRAAEAVIKSGEFDAPVSASDAPASPAAVATRLAVLLASSPATGQSLLAAHFRPAEEDAFSKAVATFMLSLPLQTESPLRELADPMLSATVDACVALASTAPDSSSQEVPFVLQLLQQCLSLMSATQLETVSRAFCSPGCGWLLHLASNTEHSSAVRLAEQLLQHGGTAAIQMLAGLLMAARGASSSEKKKESKKSSRKSAAPATIAPDSASSLLLARLLLRLLSSGHASAAQWLAQLQPSFFSSCLESMASTGGDASVTATATGDVQTSAELYAQLAALFLASEVSPLYVTLLVQRVAHKFGLSDSAESAATASLDAETHVSELLQLLPLLVRAASSTHLRSLGGLGSSFLSFLLRALVDVFVPYFLQHHLSLSKDPDSHAALAGRLGSITELARVLASASACEEAFDLPQRQQLLQLVLTGSKPELVLDEEMDGESNNKKTKKSGGKKAKKKSADTSSSSDDSSDSSDSDSSDDEEEEEATVPAANSVYESFTSARFQLALALMSFFPPASSPDALSDAADALSMGLPPGGLATQASLAQCYAHFMLQCFGTLLRGLKASAKRAESVAALAAAAASAASGGDVDMAASALAKTPKGLMSPEFEAQMLATLNDLLSAGITDSGASAFSALSSSGGVSAAPSALPFKWVSMLPLSQLLALSPNPALSTALLGSYAKLFPSLLRYGASSLPRMTLLRNALLWQLAGRFSRGMFVGRIVPLRTNHCFAAAGQSGADEDEGVEEPEVPSLLSICALAASPDTENFQPLSQALKGSRSDEGVVEAAAAVPTAQGIFELLVSHSRFVSSVAPGAVAAEDEESEAVEELSDEELALKAQAAQALQLEYLRLLLLLFSFPDSSPPADWLVQQNLWLLLMSSYGATSTSASDCLIKLLLDLFEEIALGAAVRKRHKKMDYALLVSHRKWGAAALATLVGKMTSGPEGGGAEGATLTEQDPTLWMYTNLDSSMLLRGPVISRRPESKISAHVSTVAVADAVDVKPAAAEGEGVDVASAGAGQAGQSLADEGESRYDPSFLLPVLHHFISHHSVDIRRLVELNVLGYILQCMSHSALRVRRMAYACMGKFQSTMESLNAKLNAERQAEKEAEAAAAEAAKKAPTKAASSAGNEEDGFSSDDEVGGSSRARKGVVPSKAKSKEELKAERAAAKWEAKKALYHDAQRARSGGNASTASKDELLYSFKEYPQLSLLLSVLKNGISVKFQLLPGIITVFLARSLPILLRPEHVLYKSINRFLLARPLLDLGDIPLFYALLSGNSGPTTTTSSESLRYARGFLLRFVREGFATEGGVDYPLVHRRHLGTILLHLLQNRGGLSDKFTRTLAAQILEGGVSASPQFLAELVRVHSFLPWVHAQIQSTTQSNQWLPSLIPILRVLDRTLQELRSKIPSVPEADIELEEDGVDLVEQEEGEKAEAEEEEDAEMKEDGEGVVAEKGAANTALAAPRKPAGGGRKSKAPVVLSPAAEALKSLRKRQRQRAQVARECTLLLESLAVKFHEFAWAERLVEVAAPTAPALLGTRDAAGASAAAQVQLQPLSVQLSVVEFVLPLMLSLLHTARKAHDASRRMTNRVQRLEEGRAGAASEEEDASEGGPHFAPFTFRPIFLHALSTLPSSMPLGPKLSAASLDNLQMLVLLSSPSEVIPPSVPGAGSIATVWDSGADVIHLFNVLGGLARSVLVRVSAGAPTALVNAFLAWLDVLTSSHPRVVEQWFAPEQPHLSLSRDIAGCYRLLASSAADTTHRALVRLNAILARLMDIKSGAQEVSEKMTAALRGAALSSEQCAAYTAAIVSLASHSLPIMSATSFDEPSAAASWHAAFGSLLLQELWTLRMEQASAGGGFWTSAASASASSSTAQAEATSRQSAAFALLVATPEARTDAAADAWTEAQADMQSALGAHAAAFRQQ